MRNLQPTERARQILIQFFEFMHNPLLLLKNPLIKSKVNNNKKVQTSPTVENLVEIVVLSCFDLPIFAGLSQPSYDKPFAHENSFLRC